MNEETSSVCEECPGRCCSSQRWIFDSVCLSQTEAESDLWREHITGLAPGNDKRHFAFASLKPRCPYLRRDNLCGIYEKRPQSCRSYICYHMPGVKDRIDKYPTHKRFLRKWKLLPGQKYGMTEEQLKDARKWCKDNDADG